VSTSSVISTIRELFARPASRAGDCTALSGWEYATTADLDRAPLHVAISPMPTLLTVLRDALQRGRRGTPAEWRAPVVSRLRAGRGAAASRAPCAAQTVPGYPSLLEPIDPRAGREPVAVSLDRLSAVDGGTLVDALEHAQDVLPAPAWERVKRAPDQWLAGYV